MLCFDLMDGRICEMISEFFILLREFRQCSRRSKLRIYRQLNFLSEPGVANEILENEPKSCLLVAKFYSFYIYRYRFLRD